MPKIQQAKYSPIPGEKTSRRSNRNSRFSRMREPGVGVGVVGELCDFLSSYIVLPQTLILVIAAWVLAAWLADRWDRFPHLAITSPDRRCGKSRLLDLLRYVCPNAYSTSNISPAAVYRLVEKIQPTLLLDEAQSIRRRFSEVSEVLRELLNAGIDREAKVIRVGGEGNAEIQEFKIYSPKVVALIGELDGVLADRCLPIDMKRKTAADLVQPYRSRIVGPIGTKLHVKLKAWAEKHSAQVAKVYDHLDVFPIQNDRMAELLLPLQAVLMVADPKSLPSLEEYALGLDANETDNVSPGVQLLAACRDIFDKSSKALKSGFISTQALLLSLNLRDWEPWAHYSSGRELTPHALGDLLRSFGIHAGRNRDQTARGYILADFEEAFVRYLPPHTPHGKPAKAAKATRAVSSGRP
jgi:hypothetical protein